MSDEIDELRSRLSDALLTIERLDAEIKTLQINQGAQSFMSFKIGSDSDNSPSAAPRAPFSLYYIDSSWKMYFPAGSFTYAGFAPSTVTPEVSSEYVPITWISSGNGTVYAHVQASVAEDGSISACDSISFDDTAANPAAGENKKTVTFKVAVVTDYLVDQVSLGAQHLGAGSSSIGTDEKSTSKNDEGKIEIKGWKNLNPESSTIAELISDQATNEFEALVRSGGKNGTIKYVPIGNSDYTSEFTGEKTTIENLAYNYSDHTIVQTVRHDYYVAGKVKNNYNVGGTVYPYTVDVIVTTATPHVGEIP